MQVRRIFVEKKEEFNVESENLFNDLKLSLDLNNIEYVRVINRYDISGLNDSEYEIAKNTVFSETAVDNIYEEVLNLESQVRVFAVEFLPGQYDQRADSAAQCIEIITQREKPDIASAKIYVVNGNINAEDFIKIKNYCINPVDSREASLNKPQTLETIIEKPRPIKILEGFIDYNNSEMEEFLNKNSLAMSLEDLKFCRDYFKNREKRDPTITEIKVIDTYWSDHCRHTTFSTELTEIEIENGKYSETIKKAYVDYTDFREFVYGDNKKIPCLMDMAMIGMKELKKRGYLKDLDISEEINACSITADVDVDGNTEKWIIMFKNETHNHPTEIEPFGGAATCLGGAIRDPLSGRAYVYQAMRVTGSGDPRQNVNDTLPGKLPQKKITIGAANGYSSYGNQIGLATGSVNELYDQGFIAKRLETGAVIGAVPQRNVRREIPDVSDVVILLGGRTGRDGCGGATGSSKQHDEDSILNSGAEVQKGNALTERKIQRFFRNEKVSKMIKRCNDFGAGGVSVAIGELTDGLNINLDLVTKKYEGLDGTELSISESQERMAVVVSKIESDKFIYLADKENLEARVVAYITDDNRLTMHLEKKIIVDLDRDFLNTNGVRQKAKVFVKTPKEEGYFTLYKREIENDIIDSDDIKKIWYRKLESLSICSQKGLVEKFDSTIGAGTVLMPFGGKYQLTPSEGMSAKIPVLSGVTNTGTLMTFGYNPKIGKWSPFHGAVYSIVEAVTKIVAMGGDYKNIRLSMQEFFERLGKNPEKWGKPFSALLGAIFAQNQFCIPAIGGKDSMSGTFNDLNVPPTLIAFAVDVIDVRKVISPEFKNTESKVVLLKSNRNDEDIPDFPKLKINFECINSLIASGKVISAQSIRDGGVAEAISKMCFGNKIGFRFKNKMDTAELFSPDYGSVILELKDDVDLEKCFESIEYIILGTTQINKNILVNEKIIQLKDAIEEWEKPLNNIFPIEYNTDKSQIKCRDYYACGNKMNSIVKHMKPSVFIPVFPGTNCEYDSTKAFEEAGGTTDIFVFRNNSSEAVKESIKEMVKRIKNSQIIMLPGGFSAGDEPDGSGKFIAAVFRNSEVSEAVMSHLINKDGLMLGICNGFQALVKLGLLPFGEIIGTTSNTLNSGNKFKEATLTFNKIGRHVSTLVSTKIVSNLSPWFNNVKVGDIHVVPVSHGEGRFYTEKDEIDRLFKNGQVATQYVDFKGNPSNVMPYNPNGSIDAIEGITNLDGRILGKMAHSERIGSNLLVNVPGGKDQKLFEAGINYFK